MGTATDWLIDQGLADLMPTWQLSGCWRDTGLTSKTAEEEMVESEGDMDVFTGICRPYADPTDSKAKSGASGDGGAGR